MGLLAPLVALALALAERAGAVRLPAGVLRGAIPPASARLFGYELVLDLPRHVIERILLQDSSLTFASYDEGVPRVDRFELPVTTLGLRRLLEGLRNHSPNVTREMIHSMALFEEGDYMQHVAQAMDGLTASFAQDVGNGVPAYWGFTFTLYDGRLTAQMRTKVTDDAPWSLPEPVAFFPRWDPDDKRNFHGFTANGPVILADGLGTVRIQLDFLQGELAAMFTFQAIDKRVFGGEVVYAEPPGSIGLEGLEVDSDREEYELDWREWTDEDFSDDRIQLDRAQPLHPPRAPTPPVNPPIPPRAALPSPPRAALPSVVPSPSM